MSDANDAELIRLRESEEKYRGMIEMAKDAIFTIDAVDSTILEMNPEAEQMTGYSKQELIGHKVWELHPEGEMSSAQELFAEVVRTGKGVRHEMHLKRKDGDRLHIEVSAAVITYGAKKVIQRICRDITETWNLHQRNEYMRQYFRSILDMMPIGLGVRKNIDKTPEVEFENKNLIDMFKRAQEQGCNCAWHTDDSSDEVAVTPTVNQNGVYAEERVFPDNRVYQFTANYFRDFENNWRELQIVQDVTERHRLEQQLQAANEELEQKVRERTRELEEKHTQLVQAEKMALLGNLVAGVAHEINTPLGALKSNYDLFARSIEKLRTITYLAPEASDEDEMPAAKLFDSIQKLNSINERATERIVNIVNSLRTFARLDRAEKDHFDIHEGLENTLTLVAHELKNRIEVVKDYGSVPLIECFPNQVNQVFMNIVVNAAQAIEGNGTIRISTWAEDGWVSVAICDSGRGISDDDKKRMFDPGFTTKSSGVGTGLGLSIVHQIVSEHGGRIKVESKPGEGATFTIKLPIK